MQGRDGAGDGAGAGGVWAAVRITLISIMVVIYSHQSQLHTFFLHRFCSDMPRLSIKRNKRSDKNRLFRLGLIGSELLEHAQSVGNQGVFNIVRESTHVAIAEE